MSAVRTEGDGQVFTITMNRPDRLNALGWEIRSGLAAAFCEFRDDDSLEVAILTGNGRGFCAGEDMKEAVDNESIGENGWRPVAQSDPYSEDALDKPVIAAINGYTMGGGFFLAEKADFRIAVAGAVFEVSEAKRWLLGGYSHGYIARMSHAVTAEMAFAFRFTAERLHTLGWLNRLVSPEDLLPEARSMAEHLLSLPPASRTNTLMMMHAMRARVPHDLELLASKLRAHGAQDDLMESRRAFVEKRAPQWRGWDDPDDRRRTPRLESIREPQGGEAD